MKIGDFQNEQNFFKKESQKNIRKNENKRKTNIDLNQLSESSNDSSHHNIFDDKELEQYIDLKNMVLLNNNKEASIFSLYKARSIQLQQSQDEEPIDNDKVVQKLLLIQKGATGRSVSPKLKFR
ncbi:hypothetical protein PPERSA_01873 [Pseudocohnilembus persalinus]|uniref:Uncharacterized protein n=1 Tax=Pseudocohnilembus persalinus TaxID=266149 RepID=A0A0V0R286_PSEPJ|nr:hypothetical protein PPERSA_01873 [Pseudocohnilembus persalinus]|eukprot:KRX08620.1 hypothetical protein PPERSA_01873 [Pseudocohnilembus persalinus]